MSIHSVDKTTGDITLLSGGTLWSDMPVGSIIPYGGTTAPEGALLCDGAEYLRADYPELFAVIGTSFGTPSENTKFKVPDLRETVPVGAGTSTRSDIATHDAYNVGEFKDDQFQDHAHKTHLKGLQYSEGSLWATAYDQDVDGTTTTGAVSGRVGTTTHGKQLGVTYVIKAKQTALPVDFQEGLEAIIGTLDVADSAVEGSYVTAVSETDGKVSVTREAADAVPTESSNKMVLSGGIYEAEQNEAKTRAKLGAKNLLPNLGLATSTDNGITYTKQNDGSILANGTASNWAYYNLCTSFPLEAGTYIISGKLAKDGTQIKLLNADTSADIVIVSNSQTERTFTLVNTTNIHAMLYVGTTAGAVSNLVFKPMLRLASDPDDTYVPYAMTNQQITPYVQAITNPNLLDNPWFTVNQRGLSTYSNVNYSYTVDRWLGSSGFDLYVDSDGVSVSLGNKSIFERIEDSFYNFLVGKTVTLSVLKSNGSIVSISGVVKSNGNSFGYESDSDVSLYLTKDQYANFVQVVFKNTTVKLRAVKLELGSVSTLASDTAPDYATELLKCQRYFVRVSGGSSGVAFAGWIFSHNARATIALPTSMRITPTITVGGSNQLMWMVSSDDYAPVTDTDILVYGINNYLITLKEDGKFPNIVSSPLVLRFDVGKYIDFSADL